MHMMRHVTRNSYGRHSNYIAGNDTFNCFVSVTYRVRTTFPISEYFHTMCHYVGINAVSFFACRQSASGDLTIRLLPGKSRYISGDEILKTPWALLQHNGWVDLLFQEVRSRPTRCLRIHQDYNGKVLRNIALHKPWICVLPFRRSNENKIWSTWCCRVLL